MVEPNRGFNAWTAHKCNRSSPVLPSAAAGPRDRAVTAATAGDRSDRKKGRARVPPLLSGVGPTGLTGRKDELPRGDRVTLHSQPGPAAPLGSGRFDPPPQSDRPTPPSSGKVGSAVQSPTRCRGLGQADVARVHPLRRRAMSGSEISSAHGSATGVTLPVTPSQCTGP